MKRFAGERRQGDRRQAGSQGPRSGENRRKGDRRQSQRREFFRIIYPREAAPTVLNTGWRVADISRKGIKLFCDEGTQEHSAPLEADSRLELKVRFHDNETFEATGRVVRTFHDPESKSRCVVCMLNRDIPGERINKEQSFLLKQHPEYCLAAF